MIEMTRRDLIGGLTAAAVASAAGPAIAEPATTPLLTSDIGQLRRVLVHSIAPTDYLVDVRSDDLLPLSYGDVPLASRQQAALMARLREAGAEVIEVRDALAAAIDATRASGVFAAWLEAAFPRLGGDPARVTADTVLGRDPATQWRLGQDGSYTHPTNDSSVTMWTRDSAFMTPKGLVICCSVSHRRRRENVLMRFLYAHSPLLKDTPIAFDAFEAGMIVEGGDAMVVSRDLMLLGVGNRTDPRTAPLLARQLDMDILAVQTLKRDFIRPRNPGEPWPAGQLKTLLLHLDTYFTLVGPRHALTVPFLLEEAQSEASPLVQFLKGARAETMMSTDEAEAGLTMLKEFGRVTLYKRGTGRQEKLGDVKLVDYLKKQGYRFTYVGGHAPTGDAERFRHFMATVLPEVHQQGANIVQARPGRVIAYDSTPVTRAALEADGIGVDTFPGRELWPGAGGPHCLTQPLLRG